MKKIICMLLLVQSGFIMAQTKTVVTPNGEKVTFYPSAPGTADNGLTITGGNIQLGGTLTKASSLTTSATNTLAIKNLQTGAKADEIVTVDANGVLRKITNNSWDINGNAGTVAGTNFIGTTDDVDLVFKRKGNESGKISELNTAFGYNSLTKNAGKYNTALGVTALVSNTSGNSNTGLGNEALGSNTTGDSNTAVGTAVLNANTTGISNTALGVGSMNSNDSGNFNTAIGVYSLRANINGVSNVAIGSSSLGYSESTNFNAVIGANSLFYLTLGGKNVAVGSFAGIGYGNQVSDSEERPNLTSAENSIFIGYASSPLNNNSENEIVIGYNATGRGSNTVQIGNRLVTSIGGAVDWTRDSDVRLKKDIVTSNYGLNFISKLRPVTYKLKTGNPDLQTGFIAQEVESVANSIGYEFSGVVKPQNDNGFYGLRYAEFVVPLVKAVQEQQQMIESQKADIAELKAQVQALLQAVKK